jgi:hypothetical protein
MLLAKVGATTDSDSVTSKQSERRTHSLIDVLDTMAIFRLPCWLWLLSFSPISAFIARQHHPHVKSSALYFYSSPYTSDEHNLAYYDTQETLLRIRFTSTQDDALERLQAFMRSFPFALALPVQPLLHLPTKDGGVEIRFLCHRAGQASGVDGGIRFFMIQQQRPGGKIVLTAKRDNCGQTTSHHAYEEKLVVTKLLAGLVGQAADIGLDADQSPLRVVEVRSIYHKWMFDAKD